MDIKINGITEYDTIIMDTCYKFVQIHRMYNTKYNYGLLVMMYQSRFISCYLGSTLVGDVDIGGGYACMGQGYMGNLWVFC